MEAVMDSKFAGGRTNLWQKTGVCDSRGAGGR